MPARTRTEAARCDAQAQRQYAADGYVVARNLFSIDEVTSLISHYMRLREQGLYEGDFAGVDLTNEDPLRRYPRMIHMHRWDEVSLKWMIDPRLNAWLTALLGREPFAVQTMLYFKPARARGQALHQDQYYLKVKPGTCMAAWLALDRCDEDSGCMRIAAGSHLWPLLCPQRADTSVSFTDTTVPLPPGQEIRPVLMNPGDVLFFNGSVVHGSYPNTTRDRFRRALIGHYIAGEAEQVGGYYHPILRMDGSVVELGYGPDGGPCGLWAEIDGQLSVEMRGDLAGGLEHE